MHEIDTHGGVGDGAAKVTVDACFFIEALPIEEGGTAVGDEDFLLSYMVAIVFFLGVDAHGERQCKMDGGGLVWRRVIEMG